VCLQVQGLRDLPRLLLLPLLLQCLPRPQRLRWRCRRALLLQLPQLLLRVVVVVCRPVHLHLFRAPLLLAVLLAAAAVWAAC
jgi:hypothetical protein